MTRQLPVVNPRRHFPRLPILALAFVAAASLSTTVEGSIASLHHRQLRVFGEDDRSSVPSASSIPYAAVGLLRWNSDTVCTASLVANNIIVTAAECVLNLSGNEEELTTSADQPPTFFPGITTAAFASLEATSTLSGQVIKVHKQSDYWVKWTTNTYLLLEIDKPLGATIGTLRLPTIDNIDLSLKETPVQMVGYREASDAIVNMSYEGCSCYFPASFGGPDYMLHHDCDTTHTGSPGSPLLVNFSSSGTYVIGIHSNIIDDGSDADQTLATFNNEVANRGVLAPYIQQHLSSLVSQSSTDGSTSTLTDATSSKNVDGSDSGAPQESARASPDDKEDSSASRTNKPAASSTSTSSTISPAIAVICIGFVGVAWACIVFIAARHSRRRSAQQPEPLIEGAHEP